MPEKNFESALKKLEKTVEDLESKDLKLEQALKLYEDGVKHSVYCTKKLNEAQKKLHKLSKNDDGTFDSKDLNLFEEEL